MLVPYKLSYLQLCRTIYFQVLGEFLDYSNTLLLLSVKGLSIKYGTDLQDDASYIIGLIM